jgi:hypothetical protein
MNLLTKNPMKRNVLMVAAWLWSCCLMAQAPAPVCPLPTQNQVDWQRMETYAFIHFGPNTFGDREWGYGDAPVESFAPTRLDCEQWAKTVKEAGMKGIILTAKHHDGFCLWPTKYTNYSVRNAGVNRGYEGTRVRGDENSSSAEGNLAPPYPRTPAPPNNLASFDVVGSLAAACKKYGLKLGLYLSPWDRHQAFYGTPLYVEYFHAQLEELLTLPGIGRKTANLLLGDVYGKPAVVADTHFMRICSRLGFTPAGSKDPALTERVMDALIPRDRQSALCHRAVHFGREVCDARSPRCEGCDLAAICASARGER